ncbi:MAG: hypothetical protein H6909_04095 [Rickettsiaceae bacterium]|nr:hypothetical protein [Rickettsiaceae bacterium]
MNFDILIVIIFLLTTLVIGLGYGRSIKNIRDYALGDRKFSTGALIATLVATWIGGSSFFLDLSCTYSEGLYYAIPVYGEALSFLVMAYIFIPRMKEFIGKVSIAESMGELYGTQIRVIIAIAGIISSIGGIAVQFKVFGGITSYFTGISALEGIIIAASIVTLYSAFGGIKAVTFTDIFQFFTFGFAVPIVGVMIWNHAYYKGFSFNNITLDPKFSFSHVLSLDNPNIWSMISLGMYFAIPGMKPCIFQRISMGKDVFQSKKSFLFSSAIVALVIISSQWIPFLLFNISPDLEYDKLFGYIIDNYTYTGLKGLMIIGIIAMVMSSADSSINSSSVLFVNDVCKPLNFKEKNELIITKIFAGILGIGGIILALYADNLLEIVLSANSFYMPVVTVPFMLTVLGFRTTKTSTLIGMIAGFLMVSIWNMTSIQANGIVVAMAANGICLISSHYLLGQEGGWIQSQDPPFIANIVRSSRNLLQYSYYKEKFGINNLRLLNNELFFLGFGIYIIIFTINTMYVTYNVLPIESSNIMLAIYQGMIISGMLFAIYPIWPRYINAKYKEIIANILWPIVVFVIMIILNSFFLLVSNFDNLQFAVFTVNLLLIPILLGWKVSILSIMLGFYLALKLYSFFGDIHTLDISFGSPGFISIYVTMLIGAVLMIFIKPQQEYIKETEKVAGSLKREVIFLNGQIGEQTNKISNLEQVVENLNDKVGFFKERVDDQEAEIERLGATSQKILNNVTHELRLPVGNVMNFAELLSDSLHKFSKEELKELSDEVLKNSARLSSMIMNMLDLMMLDVKKVQLRKTLMNLGELVKERITRCAKIYLRDKQLNIRMKVEPELLVWIDPNYMKQVIDNLIINSIKFSEKGTIEVDVRSEEGKAIITVQDEGIGINEYDIYDIFTPFKMGMKSKAEGRGIGLALCKSAVEAHEGNITVRSSGGYTIFEVTLPMPTGKMLRELLSQRD